MEKTKKCYINDVCHCLNRECPSWDQCYRAWLTEEAKNHPHPEVPYFSPMLCGQDRCQMFVEL